MTDPLVFELIAPHPELVAVQRPGPADVALAAAVLGWLPDPDDRLRAPVPAFRREVVEVRVNCDYTGEDVRTCDCGAHEDDSAAEAVAQAWMFGDTVEPAEAPDDAA